MSRTLYVSDLDGTLLNGDSRLSDNTVRLLNRAVGAGVMFSVATARTAATVSSLFSRVDLRLPLVLMTGGVIWNPVSNVYHDVRLLPEDTVREVLEVYRQQGVPTFIYTMRDDVIHIYHIGPLNDQERMFMAERAHTPYKRFHVPDDGESELPGRLDNVMLLFTVQQNAMAEGVRTALAGRQDIVPMFYHDQYGDGMMEMEVFPVEATKARGIRTLKALTGADRVVVFGDNMNDLPMMAEADLAVAVGNALECVREQADLVIGPNTEDAVPRAILDMEGLETE